MGRIEKTQVEKVIGSLISKDTVLAQMDGEVTIRCELKDNSFDTRWNP